MKTKIENSTEVPEAQRPAIKIFGVGGAGVVYAVLRGGKRCVFEIHIVEQAA